MRIAIASLAIALVALIPSTAAAQDVELPMEWGDAITINGSRYACNAQVRGAVVLSPGDKLTAGSFRLRCARRGDAPAPSQPPPPEQSVTIASSVESACVSTIYQTISGRVPPGDAVKVADACRPLQIARSCTTSSSQPDAGCLRQLDQIISGSFAANDAAEAQRSCRRVEASCPVAGTRKVTTRVDLGCVAQLYQKTSGRPSGPAIVEWLDSCRSTTRGRCTPVAARFEQACYSQSYQFISGRPTVDDAARIARACTSVDLVCD